MGSRLMRRINTRMRVNSSRHYLDRFVAEAAASVPAGSRVLDAGAGDCKYREHFEAHRYESADFRDSDAPGVEITYVCDLCDRIPVEDGRFDLVVCTQTLEHLPEPARALTELARVLEPGGQLWLSAPLYFEEHQVPHDYFRYTRYGFEHLLERSGFVVDRVSWLEGYCGTVSHQLATAAVNLPVKPSAYGGGGYGLLAACLVLGMRPLLAGMAILLGRWDLRQRYVDGGMCKNYALVAHRPLVD